MQPKCQSCTKVAFSHYIYGHRKYHTEDNIWTYGLIFWMDELDFWMDWWIDGWTVYHF